jgi:hypothetical protein
MKLGLGNRRVTRRGILEQFETPPIAVPVTQEACDACSQSSEFLNVLLKQTVNSAPPWLLAEEQINQYAAAAGGALRGIQPSGELDSSPATMPRWNAIAGP